MTEEEKQVRADNCSPEEFNKLAKELTEKAIELYSIASRVPPSIFSTFINYEDSNGHHTWAHLATAETYVKNVNGSSMSYRKVS